MKRREAKTVPSADLLVCFPSKPICSPARCSSHHHHRRNKPSRGAGKKSPLLLSKDKQISEPTSPKVTCAGQIKVPRVTRPSWRAVVAGMADDSGGTKSKKKHNWVASLGFKKETFHLLARFRATRCDFRCLGRFLHTDEDEEEEREESRAIELETSRSMIFPELFMVLPEKEEDVMIGDAVLSGCNPAGPPPANALLLMRCRSAPCRDWLQGEKESEEKDCRRNEERKSKNLRSLMEEEERTRRSEDVVVKTETWIVGKNAGHVFRSRSWKR